MMRKGFAAAAVWIIVAALPLAPAAAAVVPQSADYYVADYAGVLSEEIERKIISSNADLEAKCDGAQIVVVTVEYLDGMYADEYATQLFNDWGVGSKEANNGMLLLLATGENKAWLTVGAGISGSFTNSMINDYFDKYFWPDFDSGRYEQAVSKMLEALFSWYADYYGITMQGGEYGTGETGPLGWLASGTATVVMFALIALGALAIIVMLATSSRRRFRSYYMGMGMPVPPPVVWFFMPGWRRSWFGRSDVPPGDRDKWDGPSPPGGGGFGGFGGFGGGGGMGHGGGGFAGGGGGRR